MKSALNGGLNLSVLDGWWAEAYNGTNGWAIPGDILFDHGMQDSRDAATLFDIIEHEVSHSSISAMSTAFRAVGRSECAPRCAPTGRDSRAQG